MRPSVAIISALLSVLPSVLCAKEFTDTLHTEGGDAVIIRYSIEYDGNDILVSASGTPRIIPSDKLRKACRGDLDKLDVVIFGRVGDFGDVRWNGLNPATFMVPANLDYRKNDEGFHILGESQPIVFTKRDGNGAQVDFPVFIALPERKQSYRIMARTSAPLKVRMAGEADKGRRADAATYGDVRARSHADPKPAENEADMSNAMGSIEMIRRLLAEADGLPFSQTLQMEIYNLGALKNRITDRAVIDEINAVMFEYTRKEAELKERQNAAALAAKAEEQALLARQKSEEEARQKEAEEEARLQAEQQQKRTFGMIAGGAVLAVLCFIGNAVIKHLGNVRNQRNIMEMQQSLTRQAESEARRRSQAAIQDAVRKRRNNSTRKSI